MLEGDAGSVGQGRVLVARGSAGTPDNCSGGYGVRSGRFQMVYILRREDWQCEIEN